jgi:hypothetical protein
VSLSAYRNRWAASFCHSASACRAMPAAGAVGPRPKATHCQNELMRLPQLLKPLNSGGSCQASPYSHLGPTEELVTGR